MNGLEGLSQEEIDRILALPEDLATKIIARLNGMPGGGGDGEQPRTIIHNGQPVTLPPARTEDSPNAYWNSSTMGMSDGRGQNFYDINGEWYPWGPDTRPVGLRYRDPWVGGHYPMGSPGGGVRHSDHLGTPQSPVGGRKLPRF